MEYFVYYLIFALSFSAGFIFGAWWASERKYTRCPKCQRDVVFFD